MRALAYWLPLRRAVSSPFGILRCDFTADGIQALHTKRQVSFRSIPADSFEASRQSLLKELLPQLPDTPRYPCPFITAQDVGTYLVPLYRAGWGISRTKARDAKKAPPATQLSKRIIFSNPDVASVFMKDVQFTITERENHHPIWDIGDSSSMDIHIHTHTALAPVVRHNTDDEIVPRKCPGITHRDIRYSILFEELLRDYVRGRHLHLRILTVFPQPTGIDEVHDPQAIASLSPETLGSLTHGIVWR